MTKQPDLNGKLPGSPANWEKGSQRILKTRSDRRPETKPGYVESLSSEYVEDLAARCKELAQEHGYNPKHLTNRQKHDLLTLARLHRRQDKIRDREARRRAREAGVDAERFHRHDIIERDNRTCYLCGRTHLTNAEIHLDHVIPISKGGPHTKANVRVACAPCNIAKAAKLLPLTDAPVTLFAVP